ncbi:MAG TPA: hypothetical protein VF066_07715 [Thermoleophilaceae bacterium]
MTQRADRSSRRRAVIRWAATVLAGLWCAIGIVLPPFGCAVGEYEENNPSCDTPGLQIAGAGVLIAGVAAALLLKRPAPQWLGIAVSFVLVLIGLDDA